MLRFLFVTVLLYPVVALAQAAVAASLPTDDLGLVAFMIARFKDGSAALAVAVLAKLLVDLGDKLLLSDGAPFASKVSRDILKWVAIVLAGLGAFSGAVIAGQSVYVAIANGIVSGFGAVGLDQAVKPTKPAGA